MRKRFGLWLWTWLGWDGIVAAVSRKLHEEIIERFKADEGREAADRVEIEELKQEIFGLRLELNQLRLSVSMTEKPKPEPFKARNWREVQTRMKEDEDVFTP